VRLAETLRDTSCGVICVTRENVESPWLNFEAGALSKTLSDVQVFPLLLDVEPSALAGPLAQFQATSCVRNDILKLVRSIATASRHLRLDEPSLIRDFDSCWSRLDSALNTAKHLLPGTRRVAANGMIRSISGWWKGVAEDVEVESLFGKYRQHLRYSVSVQFEQSGRMLEGRALVEADIAVSVAVRGKFLTDEYFVLEWEYQEPDVQGFGTSVMKVLGIGSQIEGSLLFKRLRSDGLALAGVKLTKARE
jgi:hypothetical protein